MTEESLVETLGSLFLRLIFSKERTVTPQKWKSGNLCETSPVTTAAAKVES